MILWLYRAAWEPALWIIRLCAGLEEIAGGKLWPERWRIADRLAGLPVPDDATTAARKTVWLHAASLGECKGLWAFAQTLRDFSRNANTRIMLTANTTTGLDFLRAQLVEERGVDARDAAPDRWSARLAPLDHPRVAARFLRDHKVCALVLFEVELWPHWMLATSANGTPVLWISARLTERARRRYAGIPPFAAARRRAMSHVLRGIDWAQAQTEDDARALRDLGCRAVEIGGDLRGLHYLKEIDGGRAREDAKNSRAALPDSERRGTAFVSVHAQELTALVPIIKAVGEEYDRRPTQHSSDEIWVFPRKMDELQQFVQALAPFGFALHSKSPDAARRIVDRFDLVAETLRHCEAAVIGGSFLTHDRIGGHNLWEPLLAGCRITIGPHHGNQAYLARALAKAGLLRVIAYDDRIEGRESEGNNRGTVLEAFIETESARLKQFAGNARDRVIKCAQKALF